MDAKAKAEAWNAMPADQALTCIVVGSLWSMCDRDVPQYCPGDFLFATLKRAVPRDIACQSESEFLAFMWRLVEGGIVQEKSGRAMIETDLSKLNFTVAMWLFAFTRSTLLKKGGK